MKKKYNLGGEISSLLPLLDLAIPGLGTSLSAVVGMIPGKQPTKKLETPTNPFRTFRKGGKLDPGNPKTVKVGNIEFDKSKMKPSKNGYDDHFVVTDIKTGKDFGVVLEDNKFRFRNDYEVGEIEPNTKEEDLKLISDNTAKYYKELYNSPFYKRNQPSSVIAEKKKEVNKYDKGEMFNLGLSPSGSYTSLPKKGEGRPAVVIDPKDIYKYPGSTLRGVMTHEFAHTLPDNPNDTKLIKSKLNKKNVENYHDEFPFEMQADINALRRSMKDNGVWDMKSNFNQKHLDDYRKVKSDNFFHNRVKKLTNSDDNMLQLLNSVSYVDSKPELPIVRKGGMLPQLKFGGKVKSYDLPTHEQGGGMVDKMGNPASTGVAEIEKKEVVYTDKRGTNPYVFSDTLTDSDGKTFAMKAKEYQKFDKKDQVSQATYKKLMSELQMKNDLARESEEQVVNPTQMPNGGYIIQTQYDSKGRKIRDTAVPQQTTAIDKTISNVTGVNAYKDLLGNLQSGAFPRIGRVEAVVPGSMNILDNARGGIQSQTPIDTSLPSVPTSSTTSQATPNPLGSLDLGKVGGIMKGAALVGSAIDAFQKPEQEQLRVPDFSKGDKAYTGLGGSFDPIRNDIVQQAKSGENQIMQSAGNFGQVMSRLNSLQSGVGRNLAQVGLQEKQYNDQIGMAKGQREDQKAGIKANEQIRKQTADSQNKAMGQDLVANLLQNVNNYGTEFMKQDVMTKELANLDKEKQRAFLTQLSLMNIKNPNFQINKDLINSDNPLSALTFKQ